MPFQPVKQVGSNKTTRRHSKGRWCHPDAFVNAEATFGWNRLEGAGRRMSEVFIPERYRQAHEESLRRFVSSGQTRVMNRRLEMTALHRDGREIPIELAITPIRTAQGVSFSAFIRDLIGLKEAQEARAALEEQIRRTQKLESLGTLARLTSDDVRSG